MGRKKPNFKLAYYLAFLVGLLFSLSSPVWAERKQDWFSGLPFRTAYIEYREHYPSLIYPPSVTDALENGIHSFNCVQKLSIDVPNRRIALRIQGPGRRDDDVVQIFRDGIWSTYGPEYKKHVVRELQAEPMPGPRLYDALYEKDDCQKTLRGGEQMLGQEVETCKDEGDTYYFWHRILLCHIPSPMAKYGVTSQSGGFSPEKYQTAAYIELNTDIPESVFSVPDVSTNAYDEVKKELEKKLNKGQRISLETQASLALPAKAVVDPRFKRAFEIYQKEGFSPALEEEMQRVQSQRIYEAAKALGAPSSILHGSTQGQLSFINKQGEKPEDLMEQERIRSLLKSGNSREALSSLQAFVRSRPLNADLQRFYAKLLEENDRFDEALKAYDQAISLENGYLEPLVFQRAKVLCRMSDGVSAAETLDLLVQYKTAKYDAAAKDIIKLARKEHALSPDDAENIARELNYERYELIEYLKCKAQAVFLAGKRSQAAAIQRKGIERLPAPRPGMRFTGSEQAAYQELIDNLSLLAYFELRAGRPDEALAALRDAAKFITVLEKGEGRYYQGKSVSSLEFLALSMQQQKAGALFSTNGGEEKLLDAVENVKRVLKRQSLCAGNRLFENWGGSE